jgi:rhodanese-related sulfurtransferase
MTDQIPINIEPTEVKSLLSEGAIVLVDCREQSEWETAKITGAILMPMSNWANEVDQLKQLDGKRVVVHCHHGGRSLRVVRWLRENGFPDAQNMVGGIDAWSHQIDPSVPTY